MYDGLTDAYDKIHMVSPASQKWDTWVCHLQTCGLYKLLYIKTLFRWTRWNNVSTVRLTLLMFCFVHCLFIVVRHFDHGCVIYPVTEKLSPLNRWLFSHYQFMSGLLLQTKLVAILCQASCGTTDSMWCRGENSLSQSPFCFDCTFVSYFHRHNLNILIWGICSGFILMVCKDTTVLHLDKLI